ncbi:hypothetical protein C8F04DRAFT_1198631 [Mycena alexandri]|uniref:F-box domain-containing protein n=1 Tax=Mycena alexandri TaxID=1745969 RepID=A0AAD6S0P7_9AGAR|nr:hypothetical protein C8F04DRAFT_1198631 [Mycena alexandri]
MEEFPQELVDQVIDDVAASKSIADLKTCGSVCRRWLHRSRSHLFCHITLRCTRPIALRRFMNLVDGSSVPILSFVQSLDIFGILGDQHVTLLLNCAALTKLCIYMSGSGGSIFWNWLQANIPRFGASCSSLAHLELVGLGGDLPLRAIVTAISGSPSLTHLRISSEDSIHGVLGDDTVLATEAFPRHLHSLDISLSRGTDLFFEWILSHQKPPVFTSLKLGGWANGARTGPIDAYFQLVGPQIESLSLKYWIVDEDLDAFEQRAMAHTTNLVHLAIFRQYSASLPAKFASLSSARLATISIEVRPYQGLVRADWPAMDETLATAQFAALRRISFTNHSTQGAVITARVRALMPRANARAILD